MFFNRTTKRNDADANPPVAEPDDAMVTETVESVQTTPVASTGEQQSVEIKPPIETTTAEAMTNPISLNVESMDGMIEENILDESTVEYVETMDESTILTHLLIAAMKKLDIPPSVPPNEQSKWLGEHAAIAALTAFEAVFETEDIQNGTED